MLTQFETDAITRSVIALERIADALESIRDKLPEDVPSLTEADACDFPGERTLASWTTEPTPCYLQDKKGRWQRCIRKDKGCDKCPRDIALRKELDELHERNKEHIERSGIEGGKHA